MCRTLKDPGDRSSYGSANLVHMFGKNPSEVKSQRIDRYADGLKNDASKTIRRQSEFLGRKFQD